MLGTTFDNEFGFIKPKEDIFNKVLGTGSGQGQGYKTSRMLYCNFFGSEVKYCVIGAIDVLMTIYIFHLEMYRRFLPFCTFGARI